MIVCQYVRYFLRSKYLVTVSEIILPGHLCHLFIWGWIFLIPSVAFLPEKASDQKTGKWKSSHMKLIFRGAESRA